MRAGFMGRRSSGEKSSGSGKKLVPAAPSSKWYAEQFDEYVDSSDGNIGPEGVEKLCGNLVVDPTDVLVLVFAWKLEAAQMGYFTQTEWLSASPTFGSCTSNKDLVEQLQAVHRACRSIMEQRRSLHMFTHKFCREDRKKTIDVASAEAMLMLLHPDEPHVPPLIEFLKVYDPTTKRGVSQDEWSMMFNFFAEIKPDCSNYQDDGAWPLLLDEYVDQRREKAGASE